MSYVFGPRFHDAVEDVSESIREKRRDRAERDRLALAADAAKSQLIEKQAQRLRQLSRQVTQDELRIQALEHDCGQGSQAAAVSETRVSRLRKQFAALPGAPSPPGASFRAQPLDPVAFKPARHS